MAEKKNTDTDQTQGKAAADEAISDKDLEATGGVRTISVTERARRLRTGQRQRSDGTWSSKW